MFNFVFRSSYRYIKGYGPTTSSAEDIFRDELRDAKDEIMTIYGWTSPVKDRGKYYKDYLEINEASDLVDAMREDFNKFYDVDENLVQVYWDLCSKAYTPYNSDTSRPEEVSAIKARSTLENLLPQIVDFVSINDARRAVSNMQERVEQKNFFFHCRRHTLIAERMRSEMLRDMETVLRFCYQYSGKRKAYNND